MALAAAKPAKPVAPRYQRSGLAAEAMRRALRQRISGGRFDSKPQDLNNKQQTWLKQRVQQRMQNMRKTNPALGALNPGLKKSFLQNKKYLSTDHRYEYRKGGTNPGGNFPGPGGNTAPNIGSKPDPVAPPHIQVSKNGQLDLPYNYEFLNGMLEQQDQSNAALMGLQQEDQQQNLEYQQSMRDAQQQQAEAVIRARNSFGARGLGHSTAYASANADVNRDYNNYFNDLNAHNTMFDQNIATQRGAIENSFNDYLRRAAMAYANQLEPQAGNLGYGKSRPNTTYDTPSVKSIRRAAGRGLGKNEGALQRARRDHKITPAEFKKLGPKQKKIVQAARAKFKKKQAAKRRKKGGRR